jgi:hypothetical protein
MWNRSLRKWGIGLCVLLTAVLVGCQSVGGFNLDAMILNQLEVKSGEQSGTLDIKIDWNEKFLADEMESDPELAAVLPLLSRISLNMDRSQFDEQGRSKLTGSLSLGGKKAIPFTIHNDNKNILLDIEGANQPFALDLGMASELLPAGSLSGLGGNEQALTEPVRKLIREVSSYFVKHLPNPPKLDVSVGHSSVNGQSMLLTKVHAELDGEQLGGLLTQYVDALANDEAGFKDMLKRLATWVKELPPELTEGLFGTAIPADLGSDASIQEGFDDLFPMLKEAQAELADLKETPEWKEIFDKGISLKTDLYVDAGLHIRKSDVELVLAPELFKSSVSPVRSVSIHATSEIWNVNGGTAVPDVVVPASALKQDQLDSMQPTQALRMFDENSAIYDLLKNEFRVDDSSFDLMSGWDAGQDPVLKGKVLYVPLRNTLNEFGDKVTFTAKTGELRFTDWNTWQEIVLHDGSSEALINGETKVTLSAPVQRFGSSFYMAADDLFKLMKATYEYSETEDGELLVKVKRDL